MRQQVVIGDLVEVALPYSKDRKRHPVGLVVHTRVINANLMEPDLYKWHPDEYTCLVKILGEEDARWVRAKYLKSLSKANVSEE